MTSDTVENPKDFAKWIGRLVFFALVVMAAVVFFAKMKNAAVSSNENENGAGSISNGENPAENPETRNRKHFNF